MARLAVDLKLPTQGQYALGARSQTDVTLLEGDAATLGIHPAAVVCHLHYHLAVVAADRQGDIGGLRVLCRVGELFPSKQEEHLIMRTAGICVDVYLDPEAGALSLVIGDLAKCRRQPDVLENSRVQAGDLVAKLLDRESDGCPGAIGLLITQRRQGLLSGEKVLQCLGVKGLGQAATLVLLGLKHLANQAAAAGGELLERLGPLLGDAQIASEILISQLHNGKQPKRTETNRSIGVSGGGRQKCSDCVRTDPAPLTPKLVPDRVPIGKGAGDCIEQEARRARVGVDPQKQKREPGLVRSQIR